MAEKKKVPYKQMVDKPYLGEWTLDDGNNGWIEKDGIIISAVGEEIMGERGKKPVVTAQTNLGKPFIVNVGNGDVLTQITGSKYPEDWNNVPVTFYVNPRVRLSGKTVAGLRIKAQKAQAPKPKPELVVGTPAFNKAKAAVEEGTYNLAKLKEFYTISPETQTALNL